MNDGKIGRVDRIAHLPIGGRCSLNGTGRDQRGQDAEAWHSHGYIIIPAKRSRLNVQQERTRLRSTSVLLPLMRGGSSSRASPASDLDMTEWRRSRLNFSIGRA